MALQILVAGVASVLIYLVMRGLRLAISSRSWPCTNGKIISSELEEGSDYDIGSGPTYRARIRYRYVVEGTACESTRLWFQHRWFSGRKLTAEAIRAGYPVGKAVTVHYDPRRPRIAVLETGISFENVAHLGLSLFFGWVVSTLLDLGLLTVLWMLGLAIAVNGVEAGLGYLLEPIRARLVESWEAEAKASLLRTYLVAAIQTEIETCEGNRVAP
jgi:hypothetical protein